MFIVVDGGGKVYIFVSLSSFRYFAIALGYNNQTTTTVKKIVEVVVYVAIHS